MACLTASLNIEPPTGDPKRQLGSGLYDYYLNGILPKTLSPKYTLHLNGGATFAGNTPNRRGRHQDAWHGTHRRRFSDAAVHKKT